MALFTPVGFDFPPPFAEDATTFDYVSQTVIIIGGGTNAGKFAVQLARMAGIGTIIVIAGASNKDALLKMGATHVFDRHDPVDKLTAAVHAVIGDEGAKHIYDCANTDFALASSLLTVSAASKLRTLLPLDAFDRSSRPECDAAMLDCSTDHLSPYQREFWDHVPKWLDDGKVMPAEYRIVEGLEDVDAINEALDGYADFGRSGRQGVVVRISLVYVASGKT
jgi:NADPH2:quinone reductase